ncbi:MAG: ATP-binding protein [Ornithinibacter sp.]
MVYETRRAIVEDLQARALPEQWVRDAEIVVSELLTNAFRHARMLPDGTIRVRWKVSEESVEVEVTDGGSETVPAPSSHGAWRTSGRGLRVVRTVAHEWGATQDRTGHVVWATLGGPSRRRVG